MPNIIYYIFNIPLAYMENPEGLFFWKLLIWKLLLLINVSKKFPAKAHIVQHFSTISKKLFKNLKSNKMCQTFGIFKIL